MPVKCPNCGGPHPKWECRKPIQSHVAEAVRETIAKIPKVDGPVVKGLKEAIVHATKTKFDKNAYQREYMVGWRARQKAKKAEAK